MNRVVRRLYRQQREFVLYSLIGVTGVALDFGVFLALTVWVGLSPNVATAISVSCGILNNFVLNVRFNFQVRDRYVARFLSFYLVGMIGVILSVAVLTIGGYLGWAPIWSKVVSLPIVVVVQFAMNKLVTFRRLATLSNESIQSKGLETEEHA